MAKNVFVMGTALTDVRGRLSYASSPDKQEHLEAYVSNMPKGGWLELSKYSRQQAALFNHGKKVCEARELIIGLPNDLSRFNPQKLAIILRDEFSKKHKVPCAVAIHWNTAENNYHAHLIFSERSIYRKKVGESIATRNTYFDADGKRSNKKDCVDELGNLKPGCRLVKKGEALSEGSQFGAKKNIFAQEEWMREEKERLVEFFNANTRGEEWKVYDWKTDPHFPLVRIKKGEPAALTAWKERENEWRIKYNETIDKLIQEGKITVEEALKLKFKHQEQKSKLRREKAENKRIWMEEWKAKKDRMAAEREYFYKLQRKSVFGLAFELALMIAGVDVVKRCTGVEAVLKDNKPIKAYHDEKIQKMIDDMCIASGRKPPSERLRESRLRNDIEVKLLDIELEKSKKQQGNARSQAIEKSQSK